MKQLVLYTAYLFLMNTDVYIPIVNNFTLDYRGLSDRELRRKMLEFGAFEIFQNNFLWIFKMKIDIY